MISKPLGAAKFARLAELWDEELNEYPFSKIDITNYHDTYYWWRCEKCGISFESKVATMIHAVRIKNRFLCSECKKQLHRKIKKPILNNPDISIEGSSKNHDRSSGFSEYAYLEVLYPELAKIFVLCVQGQLCNWKCPVCSGTYAAFVNDMITEKASCPYCNGRLALLGKKSLAIDYPDLARLWSPKNTKTADEVLSHTHDTFLWVCLDCNEEFTASVSDMVSGEMDCPYCNDRKLLPKLNSLAVRHPNIARTWSFRNEKTAHEVLSNSLERVFWVCPECQGEFIESISSMVTKGIDCPYCNDRKLLSHFNSLAVRFEDLAKDWSANNEKTADQVLPGSSEKALWVCSTCNGEYTASIVSITTGRVSCPYCSGRKVLPGFNSLAVRFEDLAKNWSVNNEKDADQVLPGSSEKALWICPTCKGEYAASIVSMTTGEVDCPYCSGKKVLPGINSFAAKHEDLVAEWDYVNNYALVDPDHILDSCKNKVWWVCRHNIQHTYMLSPASRLNFQKRHKESCPYCKGKRVKKRHYI